MSIVNSGEQNDLKVEHDFRGGDAGPMVGGGKKLVWHTTESSLGSVDAMVDVLVAKGAEPHFVIGKRGDRWVAVQMVPLDRAGRALQHVFGPETNRANAIQVEICGRAAESQDWPRVQYKALANLTRLINEELEADGRRKVPWTLARNFSNDTRFTPEGFVEAAGHCGHKHVPGNTHWDPGDFRGALLMDLLHDMPDRGFYLLTDE
jgi:N-acetylmuramoyl-L-alanine amidase